MGVRVCRLNTQTRYWLGFSLIPTIGPSRLAQLNSYFGNLQQAWSAGETALKSAGLDNQALENVLKLRPGIDLDHEVERVKQANAHVITLEDDIYPANLREIDDAPPILYVRGALAPIDSMALAVVGTRKPTHYGRDATFKLTKHLAAQGITIVSGLAHGIDSMAHRAALEGGGRTIAVMGTGIDIIYPPDHQALAEQIVHQGALVSEFRLGAPPEGRNFPRRNRIMSGMSLGVLVTEAPEKSGALITVEVALEQGREVFAIPANIFNPMGRGTNRLIQEGAKLVLRVRDILDELNVTYTNIQTRTTTAHIIPENDIERQIMTQLGADPIHIDDLTRMTGLSAQTVSSTLTILELKGLAQNVGHMQYSRVLT